MGIMLDMGDRFIAVPFWDDGSEDPQVMKSSVKTFRGEDAYERAVNYLTIQNEYQPRSELHGSIRALTMAIMASGKQERQSRTKRMSDAFWLLSGAPKEDRFAQRARSVLFDSLEAEDDRFNLEGAIIAGRSLGVPAAFMEHETAHRCMVIGGGCTWLES